MSQSVSVIEGQYFQDLTAQPAALDATLEWLAGVGRWTALQRFFFARQWKRVVLTGMGSSFHAFHPFNLALIECGLTPVLMETSELLHYGRRLLDEETLVVVASQSGRSAETLRFLQVNEKARVLGITNTADSPLARAADCVLLLQAGPEATVSCKTYVCTILALRWLAAVVRGTQEEHALQALAPAAGLAERYLRNLRVFVHALAETFQGTRHLFLVGRGESLAAAGTGALIVKESAHFHAEGMSSAAFRHGPLEMVQGGMRTFVFDGDPRTSHLNRQLIRDLVAAGGLCDDIGVEATSDPLRLPACDGELRPILEILPVQMMTLALAANSGREAGRFQHATKITVTE